MLIECLSRGGPSFLVSAKFKDTEFGAPRCPFFIQSAGDPPAAEAAVRGAALNGRSFAPL